MKRILLLSLLLLPIVALAQYPTFSNKQKLGVQTTGDGLIYRGTTINNIPNYTPSNVNNAYFHLDTTNNKLYLYNATAWQLVYPTPQFDTTTLNVYLKISDTTAMLLPYFRDSDTTSLNLINRFALKLNISDTATMLTPYMKKADTISLSNRINLKLNISDTTILSNRITTNANNIITINNKLATKLDTIYVKFKNVVTMIENKDTINIGSSLTDGYAINIIGDSVNVDTTLLDIRYPDRDSTNELQDITFATTAGIVTISGSKVINLDTLYSSVIDSVNLLIRDSIAAFTPLIEGFGINIIGDSINVDTSIIFTQSDTITLSNRINNKLNISDTVSLSNRIDLKLNKTDTINLSNRIDLKLNKSDTISLSNRINIKLNASDTVSLSNRINKKLDTLYVNYPTYIDTITNKDTIQIEPSLVLTEGFGINIIADSINIDSTVILATQQKQIAYVKNQSGVTMYKGQAVYSSGSSGNNKLVTLASSATEQSSSKTFGVVETDSIPNGSHGYIITFGLLSGFNTDNLTQGSSVYLSNTPGQLTTTKPQAPLHLVTIGVCIRQQQNTGSIFVKIQNGFEFDELHDVRLTTPVDKSSIYYNLSEDLWRDTTAALLVSDTSAFVRDNQISGTSGQVAYFNSSNSVVSDTALRWSAANKSLGINMTTVPSGANLIIKNSQEPVRSTVVATQTFGADTTNWTRGTGWTFNGTQAVATAATGDLTYTPALTITSGNAYEITYTLSSYSAGTLRVFLGNITYSLPTYNLTNNVIVIIAIASAALRFTTVNFTGNLDNVSVVQIANPSSILLTGQDDNNTTLYSPLRMPNQTTIGFGGGGAYNTGANNVFYGQNAGQSNTTGFSNVFIGNLSGQLNTTGNQNNFFGLNTGANNTTGLSNNFFGAGAGQYNTTGVNNNFFGLRAGQANTTGTNNNCFGNNAGLNNTTGFQNNFFGNRAGELNTTGAANNFFGTQAGSKNTTGDQNSIIGEQAGLNNTTGSSNTFISTQAGLNNTTGSSNTFISTQSGYVNTSGSNNVSIGHRSMFNNTTVDFLTGSNNIALGTNAADNIAGAAAGNVAIGNAVDLPTNNGSNQGVYQNVLFFTGASGTGTTIAAASKAGIKTNAPNRDLEVAGEVRITDLTTDAPTRLVGADADGDLGQVTLGAGLSLASSSLLADTNFLVTRFDTASMLTNYLRTGTAASTYLPLNTESTMNATLNINGNLNMGSGGVISTPILSAGTIIKQGGTSSQFLKANGDVDSSTYLTTGSAASTYLPLTGGTLSGDLGISKSSNSILRLSSADAGSYGKLIFSSNNGSFLNYGASIESSGDGVGIDVGSLNFLTGFGTVRTNRMTITPSGNLSIINSATIGGTLGVTGATTLSSTLGVTGVTNLSNSLYGINQGLSSNLTISDIIPGNSAPLFTTITTGPSSSETVRFGLNQSLGGGANMFMGGTQGLGGNPTNPNIFFTDSRKAYASIGGIHTSSGTNNQSGHIVFTTTPSLNTIALTERMRIAQDGAITMGGTLGVTGATTLSAPLTVNSSAVFNEAATDSDFRVESEANANMLFVDASTSRVGIGYASPTKTLDVNGEVRINTVTATPTSLLGKNGSNVVGNVTLGSSLTLSSGTLSVNNKITDINTSSYSILSTDYYIDNFNSSSTTIILPLAGLNLYRELKFKNSSTGALTANGDIIPLSGSGTTTTILSATNAKWCTLVSDGTYWRIMQSN